MNDKKKKYKMTLKAGYDDLDFEFGCFSSMAMFLGHVLENQAESISATISIALDEIPTENKTIETKEEN